MPQIQSNRWVWYGSFHYRINVGCACKNVRTCAIPERLRGVFMTRCCTNPRLPYLYLFMDAYLDSDVDLAHTEPQYDAILVCRQLLPQSHS